MARPQQPELARSGKTDIDPDHVETGLQGQPTPATGGETGPIPPENQPGHHPPKEQDKPDLDAFAARLGTDPKAPTATSARKGPRPKTTPAKTTPAKTTPANKAAPATAATRPAGPKGSPAAPPKVQTTPAKRPAAAPTAQPQSAPSPEDAARIAAPQPAPEREPEPPLVGLFLLPLRGTIKGLEQLDRTLTERLKKRLATGGPGSTGR
ncbi:MAG: hypothetical protein LC792_20505 [Actinobacteria bacterium]|nr:hypothetical protein [Actinomycetota bacterium]